MIQKDKFNLANTFDFSIALMNFEDGIPTLQKRPLQTIGDRVRLIDNLENKGYHIISKEDLMI